MVHMEQYPKLKSHHKLEVKKQYLNYKNWVQPYYIERYYEILDEYRSEKVGYDLSLIASHMDAFYSNSDNFNIPVMDALRVVSLVQDNENKRANLRFALSAKISKVNLTSKGMLHLT